MNRFLVAGTESLSRVKAIFKLTKIESEDVREAVIDHLVKGFDAKMSVARNGIDQPNFNRALRRLNEKAEVVEEIKEDDWPGYYRRSKEAGIEEEHF